MKLRLHFGWIVWIFLIPLSQTVYSNFYPSFAPVAKESIKGVVNIRVAQASEQRGNLNLYEFFSEEQRQAPKPTHSLGSGIVYDRAGHIVTNYHVIQGAKKIEVFFSDSKKTAAAILVGVDRKTDIAILKVPKNLTRTPLAFGNSDLLRVGDVVLAIGNPFGFSHSLTGGIISAKGRVLGSGVYDDFLQTDAMIHPGNSGGPLIDVRGRVIGINTAVSTKGIGIGFAIPINLARLIIKDLIKHGKVKRPWLGIVGHNILTREEVAYSKDPDGVYGVIVNNIVTESPAFKAGFKIGDLILAIDDNKVFAVAELLRFLIAKSPDETARFRVYRKTKGFINLVVPLEEAPKSQDLPDTEGLF